MKTVTFDALNAEWRCVKSTLQGTDLGLRMRRALSWIECAENADNYDAKFIFYVPRFVSLMMFKSNHGIDWGPPRFPVVD